MRRLAAILTLTMGVLVLPANALAFTSPTWNLDGTYTIPFTCVTGCPSPPDYPYSVTISTTSDITGAVTGTGSYIPGAGDPSVTVAGGVSGWDVTLNLTYSAPYLSYNPWTLIGEIDQYGGMAGTASDGQGRTFTWLTTSGSVGLYSPRCEYGTYAAATNVWDGFAPGTGETVTTPALDPTRDYFVEASGTYFAAGDGLFDIQADAEYSEDAQQRLVPAPWTDAVHNYESYGEVLLDLTIDGGNVDWGPYNAGHRYAVDVPSGSALALNANIYDVAPGNNTGGLCVALFEKDYDFDGFFRPVDNLPTLNMAKAGSAIPVKFSLHGNRGLNIFSPGFPTSKTVACGSTADVDTIEVTVTAGGSSLSYDATGDQYIYVWKTDRAWASSCRTLTVKLADGTVHQANFKFTK